MSDKFGGPFRRQQNIIEEVVRKVTQRYKEELMIKLQISQCTT